MRNIWRAGRIDFLSGARVARLCAVVALAAATCASGARAAPPPKVDVVAFGLWGEQSVFASEAASAARIVARQYGHGGKVVVRANTRLHGEATEENLRATLASLGAAMDPERDILFLILTSHGDEQGVGIATPSEKSFITPIELREMLRESGARLSVVVVSACYSGIFAQALAETRHARHHCGGRGPCFLRLPRRREMDDVWRGVLRRGARADQDLARSLRPCAKPNRGARTGRRLRSVEPANGGRRARARALAGRAMKRGRRVCGRFTPFNRRDFVAITTI